MRLLSAVAVVSIALTGMFGAYSYLPSKTADDDFPAQYVRLARATPDELITMIATTLPQCLTREAQAALDDPVLADFAAKTFFKSGLLMAEGKSAEQASEEFIPWLTEHSKALNPAQKEIYADLVKTKLNTSDVMLCLYSAIRTSIANRIDLKAKIWELRT